MSRHAAATNAGRSRTVQRTAPAVPRRVSGPLAPNRRDADGSRAEQVPQRRVPRTSGRQPAPAGDERAAAASRAPRARVDAAAARAPRARIDASALAYADVAVAAPAPFTARRTFVAPRPQRLAYGGVAIASRVANVAVDVSASRFMDRLVRGRVWIGVVGFCLIGLVAMQVSLLKLNSGIGRAVQTTSTLERSNAALRAEISRLSAGDRIERLAGAAGSLVMPAPSDVTYLRAGRDVGAAARAAQRMKAHDPNVALGPAGSATQTAVPAGATAPGPALGTTPGAATAPAGTAPAATAPVTTAPAVTAQAQPVATTQPAVPGAAAPSGGATPQATTAIP